MGRDYQAKEKPHCTVGPDQRGNPLGKDEDRGWHAPLSDGIIARWAGLSSRLFPDDMVHGAVQHPWADRPAGSLYPDVRHVAVQGFYLGLFGELSQDDLFLAVWRDVPGMGLDEADVGL